MSVACLKICKRYSLLLAGELLYRGRGWSALEGTVY